MTVRTEWRRLREDLGELIGSVTTLPPASVVDEENGDEVEEGNGDGEEAEEEDSY